MTDTELFNIRENYRKALVDTIKDGGLPRTVDAELEYPGFSDKVSYLVEMDGDSITITDIDTEYQFSPEESSLEVLYAIAEQFATLDIPDEPDRKEVPWEYK